MCGPTLHYATKRATDVLHLNMQEQMAHRLGYSQTTALLRSEAFMKDYYEHTRNIFRITERITEQFVSGQSSGMLRALSSAFSASRAATEERLWRIR